MLVPSVIWFILQEAALLRVQLCVNLLKRHYFVMMNLIFLHFCLVYLETIEVGSFNRDIWPSDVVWNTALDQEIHRTRVHVIQCNCL